MIDVKEDYIRFVAGDCVVTFDKKLPKRYHKQIDEALHRAWEKGRRYKLRQLHDALELDDLIDEGVERSNPSYG